MTYSYPAFCFSKEACVSNKRSNRYIKCNLSCSQLISETGGIDGIRDDDQHAAHHDSIRSKMIRAESQIPDIMILQTGNLCAIPKTVWTLLNNNTMHKNRHSRFRPDHATIG